MGDTTCRGQSQDTPVLVYKNQAALSEPQMPWYHYPEFCCARDFWCGNRLIFTLPKGLEQVRFMCPCSVSPGPAHQVPEGDDRRQHAE